MWRVVEGSDSIPRLFDYSPHKGEFQKTLQTLHNPPQRATEDKVNRATEGGRNEDRSRRISEAVGHALTRAAGSLRLWDLIGMASTDMVLCQINTRNWPAVIKMETLVNFPVPPNCRRLARRCRDRQRPPSYGREL
jgi:hypothetical protein